MKYEKLRKLFIVQTTQSIIAICIVYIVETISAAHFLSFAEYCTPDIALAVCSGYLGAFFGRWSENWWDGVIISIIGLFFSAMLYGISQFFQNDMTVLFMRVLLAYYVVSMLLEYLVCPLIKSKCNASQTKKEDYEEYIGYKNRDV